MKPATVRRLQVVGAAAMMLATALFIAPIRRLFPSHPIEADLLVWFGGVLVYLAGLMVTWVRRDGLAVSLLWLMGGAFRVFALACIAGWLAVVGGDLRHLPVQVWLTLILGVAIYVCQVTRRPKP